MAEFHNDEPSKSPIGQVFLRLFSPKSENIINCVMGLSYPIDIQAFKTAFSNSIMFKNPRFCSLIVRDNNGTKNHWKRTCINIDDHFIIHQNTTIVKTDLEIEDGDDKEAAINSFLAEISVSTPLNENKPLWELHVLMDLNCVVLRVHHSLGDGVSLMSLLSSCFCPKNEIISEVNEGDYSSMKDKSDGRKKGIWKLIKSLWLTMVFILRLLGRILWVKDKVSVVSGGDGVELWPRKLVTAKFMLEDLKSIKLAIPNAVSYYYNLLTFSLFLFFNRRYANNAME